MLALASLRRQHTNCWFDSKSAAGWAWTWPLEHATCNRSFAQPGACTLSVLVLCRAVAVLLLCAVGRLHEWEGSVRKCVVHHMRGSALLLVCSLWEGPGLARRMVRLCFCTLRGDAQRSRRPPFAIVFLCTCKRWGTARLGSSSPGKCVRRPTQGRIRSARSGQLHAWKGNKPNSVSLTSLHCWQLVRTRV